MDKNIISKKELDIIYNKIILLVDGTFVKLYTSDKKILVKYIYKTIVLFGIYYYNENFVSQMFMNKYQDIFSILVLMMPFFDLNKAKNIQSLDELFLNEGTGAKALDSSYYVDHEYLKEDIGDEKSYLDRYFKSVLMCVYNTLSQTHCVLYPNWYNIFPYTMETYSNSKIFQNFVELYEAKNIVDTNITYDLIYTDKHTDFNFEKESIFALGYNITYGVIRGFLYDGIKKIKWLIYDINIENAIIVPNIIYLGEKLSIANIINKPWEKLTLDEKNNFTNIWEKFYTSGNISKISLRSLVLFYLRWEQDNEKLDELGLSKKNVNFINTNIDVINEDDTKQLEFFELKLDDQASMFDAMLEKIYPKIKSENIYVYIYNVMHQLKYTWYGYCCLDDNKNILTKDDFFTTYFQKTKKFTIINSLDKPKYYYLTPKNIYNYCKSLVHYENGLGNKTEYISLSTEPNWNNMCEGSRNVFVAKFNDKISIDIWFKIGKNIERTFGNTINHNIIMREFRNIIVSTPLIVHVIIQTLVYNGMFSFFKYNPVLTDETIVPDKNSQYAKWKNHVLTNVDTKSYLKSYHPFSNTTLEAQGNKTAEIIAESTWYTGFGANWIAQIQLYHHFLHNRVLFVTGATGAGKSTIAPFLLVYAVKILRWNNNAKVVCTQPRIQPVKDNCERMGSSIGIPLIIKKNNDLDDTNEQYKNTKIGEAIKQDINYIQYKHGNGELTDDIYHPCLRLYTDGSLYNIVKENYFFKKSKKNTESNAKSNAKQDYLETNIFDVILVDEAHEHNTYMDMILTLAKFGVYINNQITLGIISATMDDDEIIYRKYFELLDDNWKVPLSVLVYDNFQNDIFKLKKYSLNANLIDRRIHLSIPFGGMNFEVKEYPNKIDKYPESVGTFIDMKKINAKVIELVKYILSKYPSGDILIFQPGESDIKKLVSEINMITPSNVIALPFYSKLNTEILENIVKKIADKDVRKHVRYPKNKYDITQIYNIPSEDLLPENTYTRFIIIATNIAEASITIDSLVFVIETGNQKIMVYNPETNQENLETREIAVPNQKQRKGRVGRVKPGFAYYTYDRTLLGEKVVYKINIENVNSMVLDLITTTDTKLFGTYNDPYIVDNLDKILPYLSKQYTYVSHDKENNILIKKLYHNEIGYRYAYISNIIYPYADGKYKLETLEDPDGKFYIIHPSEDFMMRDINLNIIEKKKGYVDKIIKAFEYGKIQGIIGENNLLTPYGILVNSFGNFMEFASESMEFAKMILDWVWIEQNYPTKTNIDLLKYLLLYIVFKNSTLNFKTSNYFIGKADYLIYSSLVSSDLYSSIGLSDIEDKLKPDLKNLNELIVGKVNDLIVPETEIKTYSSNSKTLSNQDEIKKMLIGYYLLKIRIDIIKFNSEYSSKNIFDKSVEKLVKLTQINVSIQIQTFCDKFIMYWSSANKYMKKNVLLKLINEYRDTNLFNEQNEQNEKMTRILNDIEKLMNTKSVFENDFLPKIKLADAKAIPDEIITRFNELTQYDKLCWIICKNFSQNILIKIPETDYYIGYYKKDINQIYSLETNIFNENVTKTKVPNDIRNFYIFGLGINDGMELNNIMVLSELVITILNDYFKLIGLNMFKTNLIRDEQKCIGIYQDKYDGIKQKIDKITKYIINNNI